MFLRTKVIEFSNFTPCQTEIKSTWVWWISFANQTNIVRVHLHYSESESDITSDLMHCFQSVCLYYSDKDQRKQPSRMCTTRSLTVAKNLDIWAKP